MFITLKLLLRTLLLPPAGPLLLAGVGLWLLARRVWAAHRHEFTDYLPSPIGLLQSTDALHELLGDAMRELLAATHLRRHEAPQPPGRHEQ
jgi:hypothetical protein